MAKLIVFDSGGRREVDLKQINSIGRHPQNDIQILDRVVSKTHCILSLDKARGFVLKDNGSLNGTHVNRQKIESEAVLKDGDEIKLGNTRCLFLSEDSADKATRAVDVSDEVLQSHIRSKIAPQAQDRFLPEKEVKDDKALRADYEKLRVVYELQRDIGLDLALDKILARILERTFEFLNCDRGVILMADEKGDLKPRVHKTKKADEKLVLSSTLLEQVRREKAGILSSDAQIDNRFKQAHSIIMQGIRSSMAVPILHQDELLGILIIDSSVAVAAYTEKDLQLLSNIANQTAQFIKNSQMAQKIERDAATRERFQRLLSPDLAEMVVSGELTVEKGGTSRTATVLFADIRGFTSMSENMAAGEVLQMLNEYFEEMVEVVFRQEGTVDKFVGDEIMVIWGAPVAHTDDAIRAVRAALHMQAALTDFNKNRVASGSRPIEIGIGINTGDLVAGYIGSTRTMSYSVIGDTVNTAARLCSAAKAGQIIISENTYLECKDEFKVVPVQPVVAKGKAKPVPAYNVVASNTPDIGGKTASQRPTTVH